MNNYPKGILPTIDEAELAEQEDTDLPGVYILYSRGIPVYVGQSRTIYSRIYAHSSNRTVAFDSWRVLPIVDDALRQFTETAMIWALKPEGNVYLAMKTAAQTFENARARQACPPIDGGMTIEEMQQMIIEKKGLGTAFDLAQHEIQQESVRPMIDNSKNEYR